MGKIVLLLHPGAALNRSMKLYAERLKRHVQVPGSALEILELPNPFGFRKLNELLQPPLRLPWIKGCLVHLMDHAHTRYLKFLRVPALVTLHDLIVYKVIRRRYPREAQAYAPLHTKLMYLYNIRELARAQFVITPSFTVARELKELFPHLPSEVVPHGVDDEFFQPLSREEQLRAERELGFSPSPPFLLQVTNGFFYKNDPGVLRAFARVAEQEPGVMLVRVGPITPQVRTFMREYPELRIVLKEKVSFTTLRYLYSCASALLHPSWDEGFGWPPLEAMASGCPVITSDWGALKEFAAPAAWVASPLDPGEIARGALTILRSPSLQKELEERGREHARQFSWKRTGELMEALYSRFLP